MDFTGKFTSVGKDYLTGKYTIALSVNEDVTRTYERLKECNNLDITIKKHREKRSLDANAYMWVLLQKIADGLSYDGYRVDKWDVYLDVLADYGVFTHVIVKPAAVERVKEEWRAVKELGKVTVNGQTGIQLQCYYGSHSYDTKEMSRLIDGVVRLAKEMGIETLPPAELERMKREWGVEIA